MEKKLDPEFKKKWVAALRSGEYKQTCRTIYDREENAFCCLGVAAVIHGLDQNSHTFNEDGYNKLPKAIALVDYHNDTARKLININDSGYSFSEIADYIEANL